MSMSYGEQMFILNDAFNRATVERDDDHCNISLPMDRPVFEALEKLKKDTKIGVVSVEAENGMISARFDLGFLDANERGLADLLRQRCAPRLVSAAERALMKGPRLIVSN